MSEVKKYFYLKVKETFFDSEEMKILESQKNGIVYQNLYLKLSLLSLKSEGALVFKDAIPYDETMLSSILRVDIDTVTDALEFFVSIRMARKVDGVFYIERIKDKRNRYSKEYKEWRTSVFERDIFTCQKCGLKGVRLHAHHLEKWSSNVDKRFDISNGQTLCVPCHRNEHRGVR